MPSYKLLAGLPPYGSTAYTFPPESAGVGREGTVVEFLDSRGDAWVGNFMSDPGWPSSVHTHPDGGRVLVLAGRGLWCVDRDARDAELVFDPVDALWRIPMSSDVLVSLRSLGFARIGSAGVAWITRRLSFDGFTGVELSPHTVIGRAWNARDEQWEPFTVELTTGRSRGGACGSADPEEWLAPLPKESAT